MIIARAPLRISICGGGTDLPFYSSKFGGSLVTAAINKYIYVLIEKREFAKEFLIRYSKNEVVKEVKDIEHARIKAALELLNITDPLEIISISEVPSNSGLGSSSVFTVALLKALHAHKREEIAIKRLAEEAAEIEMKILKEPIGKQDHYAAAFGGVINLEIDKNGNVETSPLNISYSTLEELEMNLLMFGTGINRSASEVILDQKKATESDQEKMKQMHIIKEIGLECKKCLEEGDALKFGKWLNVHWETKKKFGRKMSSDEIDRYYQIGLENGGVGGKLIGAGGGGFLLFYCDKNKKVLREALFKEGLSELPFRFEMDGCKIIYQN